MTFVGATGRVPSVCFHIIICFVCLFANRQPELYVAQNIGGCLNPLGLIVDSRLMYSVPLSQDTGILFRTTKFEAGVINEWSPGDELAGIAVNYEPIAVFNCRFRAGFYGNYKLLGFGYRQIDNEESSWHDTSIADRHQSTRYGFRVSAEPTLKAKFSSFIFADNLSINRIDILHEDGYFYDLRTSLPHATHDFNLTNDILLLHELSNSFMYGVNHQVVKVDNTAIRQQKLGAIAIVSGSSVKYRSYFALLTAGIYLEHPFRENSPYIAALCGFEMSLPPSNKCRPSSGKDSLQ